MNALANAIARRRAPAIGGAGIDASREAGFIASHYRYFRNVRRLPARLALEQARALPAAYVKGREWYGPSGGAGEPFKVGGELARWIESTDAIGLRDVGSAKELARLNHSGWFTFPDGEPGNTLQGHVWQLPTRKGRLQFVYGYRECEGRDETNPGSACLSLTVVRSDAGEGRRLESPSDMDACRDAARWADSMADSAAEAERDYRRDYAQGERAAEADNRARAARARLRPLVRELRAALKAGLAGKSPAICKALRDQVAKLRWAVKRERDKRDSLWSDCPAWAEEAFLAGFMDSVRGQGFVRAVRLGWCKASDWQGPPEQNPALR